MATAIFSTGERLHINSVLPVATVTGHCVQLSKHWPCPVYPGGPSQAPRWTCPCWESWRCWRLSPDSPGCGLTSFPGVQSSLAHKKQFKSCFRLHMVYIYSSAAVHFYYRANAAKNNCAGITWLIVCTALTPTTFVCLNVTVVQATLGAIQMCTCKPRHNNDVLTMEVIELCPSWWKMKFVVVPVSKPFKIDPVFSRVKSVS